MIRHSFSPAYTYILSQQTVYLPDLIDDEQEGINRISTGGKVPHILLASKTAAAAAAASPAGRIMLHVDEDKLRGNKEEEEDSGGGIPDSDPFRRLVREFAVEFKEDAMPAFPLQEHAKYLQRAAGKESGQTTTTANGRGQHLLINKEQPHPSTLPASKRRDGHDTSSSKKEHDNCRPATRKRGFVMRLSDTEDEGDEEQPDASVASPSAAHDGEEQFMHAIEFDFQAAAARSESVRAAANSAPGVDRAKAPPQSITHDRRNSLDGTNQAKKGHGDSDVGLFLDISCDDISFSPTDGRMPTRRLRPWRVSELSTPAAAAAALNHSGSGTVLLEEGKERKHWAGGAADAAQPETESFRASLDRLSGVSGARGARHAKSMLMKYEAKCDGAVEQRIRDRVENLTESITAAYISPPQASAARNHRASLNKSFMDTLRGAYESAAALKQAGSTTDRMVDKMLASRRKSGMGLRSQLKKYEAEMEAAANRKKKAAAAAAAAAAKKKEEEALAKAQATTAAAATQKHGPAKTIASKQVTQNTKMGKIGPVALFAQDTTGSKYVVAALARRDRVASLLQAAKRYETDASQSKPRYKLKGLVNRTVAQISGTQSQVISRCKVLMELLARVRTNADVHAYVVQQIALKLVGAAGTRVRLHQAIAFPLAYVALQLCRVEENLCDIFLLELNAACVYTIPYFVVRKRYPDARSYQLALGFEEGSDGKMEKEDAYLERMRGFISLYAAFVQIENANQVHPHGIDHAWAWLARVCNSKPYGPTAAILLAFLEVAGWQLLRSYPRQGVKLVRFVGETLLDMLLTNTPSRLADRARLKLFCVEFAKHGGQLKEPEGRTMPATQASGTHEEHIERGDDRAT